MLLLFAALGLSLAQAAPADLRFRLTADPATLDWNLARSSHETYVIMNIMEGLVEEGTDLRPRPALAERWDVSPDGRVYTFHLRPGVKWSDGRPLKASDFVDSWARLASPKTDSSYRNFLADVASSRAVDERTLEVRLKRTVPHFVHLLTFWVTFPIRTDLIAKHGAAWATSGKIATLGPYLLESWVKGRSIRLAKNPNYISGAPEAGRRIDTVEALVEEDDARARALFEEGKLDFLLEAKTSDLLKGTRGARVEQFPYLATYYLGFNVTKGPLVDPALRRALALAVDREAIPSRLQGGQLAARGWVPPGMDGHNPSLALKGTLYEARGALMKAGYAEGSRFPKLTIWVQKFDGAETLAEFLVSSFRDKLGLELDSRVSPPAEFQKAVRSGKASLFVAHWGADYPDPSNFYEVFASGSGTSPTRWKSAEYDALLKAAGATLDMPARLGSYAEAESLLLLKDVVIVPLFYRRNTVLVGPRVKKLEISPLNYLFLKAIRLAD
jgi:oligopeptide transport system substrate-binding protein